MVYSTALERRHARKGIESSNLSSSARSKKYPQGSFLLGGGEEVPCGTSVRDSKPFSHISEDFRILRNGKRVLPL